MSVSTIKISDVRDILALEYARVKAEERVRPSAVGNASTRIMEIAVNVAGKVFPHSKSDRLAFYAIVRGEVPETPYHKDGDPPFIARQDDAPVLVPVRSEIKTTPNFMGNPDALLIVKTEHYNEQGSLDLLCRKNASTGIVRCQIAETSAGRLTSNFIGEIGSEDEARRFIAHGLPTIDRKRHADHPNGWGPARYEIARLRSIVWESLVIRSENVQAIDPNGVTKS